MDTNLVLSFNDAQSRLVVQTADLPLGTLADMVESKSIDLEPGFQRRERWSAEKQSALIESFLLNVPVPPVYLAEENDGRYTAIDGKQRLKAISEFIHNRFSLKGLDRLNSADGLRFDDLPTEITNALRLRPFLRVVTLLKQTDPLLKYEVFLRLNRGGEALNAQEIRNVAFRGTLNDTLYEVSQSKFLWKQLKIESVKSAAYKEMNDAEYVLRFLTLRDDLDNFSGNLSKEMDEFMRKNMSPAPAVLNSLRQTFEVALARCEAIWGEHAFHRPEANAWRDQTLAGMYDAQMIACSLISEAQFLVAVEKRNEAVEMTRNLFGQEEFDKSVRTGTNTPARVRYRVTKIKELLESL